jgi:hypothetical protein
VKIRRCITDAFSKTLSDLKKLEERWGKCDWIPKLLVEVKHTKRRTYLRDALKYIRLNFEPTMRYLRKRISEHKATRLNGFLCSHATRNATMDARNIFLDLDKQKYNPENVSRDGKRWKECNWIQRCYQQEEEENELKRSSQNTLEPSVSYLRKKSNE